MFDWITPDWPAPKSVSAVQTTRQGGYSQGPYASMNLGEHVGDDLQKVAQNQQQLMTALKLSNPPFWLKQVHSNRVIDLDNLSDKIHPDRCADATITQESQQACAVLTADCLPVILCNQSGTWVAAIHAGWRGLLNGIIKNTVTQYQGHCTELMAWLGPCIGPRQFEVGKEVVDSFLNDQKQSEDHPLVSDHEVTSHFFCQTQRGKFLGDLRGIGAYQLQQLGVKVFSSVDPHDELCTMTQTERFFSYRREGQTGRMATLIWLNNADSS